MTMLVEVKVGAMVRVFGRPVSIQSIVKGTRRIACDFDHRHVKSAGEAVKPLFACTVS